MCEMYNEFDIKIPPFISIRVPDISFTLNAQSLFINNKARCDVVYHQLANSAALLSRLMARRKNSFRLMKGYKLIQQLNSTLSRLLKVDIRQTLSKFFQMLSDGSLACPYEVPSRSSVDYLLIKIISAHKLYERISWLCENIAKYFIQLLKKNFFMESTTLILAVIAKLWNLITELRNAGGNLYNELITLRSHLPQANSYNCFDEFVYPKRLDLNIVGSDTLDQTEDKRPCAKKKNLTPQLIQHTSFPSPKLQKFEELGIAVNRNSIQSVSVLTNNSGSSGKCKSKSSRSGVSLEPKDQ